MGFLNRRRIKKRARRIQEIRERFHRRDFDGVIARMERIPGNGFVVREWMLVEWFIRDDPAFADALWRQDAVFVHAHAWVPIYTELIERGTLDPHLAIERSQGFDGRAAPIIPFAVAQMLIRSSRHEEALDVGRRWLADPTEKAVLQVTAASNEDRHATFAQLDALPAPEPNSRADILVETCRALQDPDLPFRLWSSGGHSSLNSPLIQEIPRRADSSAHSLYLVRNANARRVVWTLATATSEEEACRLCASRVGAPAAGVARLHSVAPGPSRLCVPSNASVGIVARDVQGIGTRETFDYTGLSEVRQFHDALDPRRELTMTRLLERDFTWPDDLPWPKPRAGAWLPAPFEASLQSGLFD